MKVERRQANGPENQAITASRGRRKSGHREIAKGALVEMEKRGW